MTTNIRKVIALAAIQAVFMWGRALCVDVTAPGYISDLAISTGPQSGSVILTWTAPGDDGTTGTAFRYVVKYQLNNPISSEFDWTSALFVDGPPLHQTPPDPLIAGSTQSMTVTGLEPGTIYGFSIKTFDEVYNVSPLSNNATGQTTFVCVASTSDGEGTASLAPSSLKSGLFQLSTVTYTAGPTGISQGGVVLFRIPDFWSPPTTNYAFASGFVNVISTEGGTFNMSISGQEVKLTATSALPPGKQVVLQYLAYTCDAGTVGRFRVKSQVGPCGQLTELTGVPLNINTVAGDPYTVTFEDYELLVPVNATATFRMIVRDSCWHVTSATSNLNVYLEAVRYNSATGTYIPDTDALMDSTSPSFSSSFTNSTVTILATNTSKLIYYKISSIANKPNNYVRLTFAQTGPYGYIQTQTLSIKPTTGTITNSSVDTGVEVPGQKFVTFTPDNDGTDDELFIRATLPESLSWKVMLSSTGFASTVRQFYGWGNKVNVVWNGFMESNGINTVPLMAPPTTYSIQIVLAGGAIVDSTLQAELFSLGIKGRLLDISSNTISNADINVFGPVSRFTRTDSTGSFQLFGLKAGTYQVRIFKPGYGSKEFPVTVTSGNLDLGNIFLNQQSILRLTVTRPETGYLGETWGYVQAFDSTWTDQAFGSIHFGVGKSTADAGDTWNVTSTTYTDILFPPNKAFTVRLGVPGYGTQDRAFSALSEGVIVSSTIALVRRPDITGLVSLPPGSNPNGMWISVDATNSGSSQQFFGGVYLSQNEASGTYRVNGVTDGSYLLRAFAPGFVRVTTQTVVAGGVDKTGVDFPVFSQGGVATGSITVNGDTSGLGYGGFFYLPINAWSRTDFSGAWTNVALATSSTQSTGTYQLTGLADGTYDFNVWLHGFETVPPGPKTLTVSGGTGTLNITLLQHSGTLTGSIILPGSNSDFNNVQIDLLPFGFNTGNPLFTVGAAGNYTISKIGTDFYTLRAVYSTTGLIVERSVRIINGQTTTMNLDMSGDTYDISGIVTTEVESLDYFVNQTTPTTIYTPSGSISVPANRIEAFRIQGRNLYDTGGGGPGGTAPTACTSPFRDPKNWFTAVYSSSGIYTFSNLSPGIYKLINNAEMDNDCSNGKEIAETSKVVAIIDQDLTDQNFVLKDGIDVTGSLRVVSGTPEVGRNIEVSIKQKDPKNDPSKDITIARQMVYLQDTSASFTLRHIPEGEYSLIALDNQFPRKYAAEEIPLSVGLEDLSGKEIKLHAVSKIQGQLRIKTSGEIVSSSNFQQLLPDRFSIFAQANPWKPGGSYQSEYPMIGPDGKFTILTGPGSYDINFRVEEFGQDATARGQKALIDVRLSGIKVEAGQIKDIGTVDLSEGVSLTGTVRDGSGNPLPNIPMEARAVGQGGRDSIAAFTNNLGQYILNGLDKEKVRYYDIYCAKRIDPHDQRFRGLTGPLYEQVIRAHVDMQTVTTVDFVTQEALGSIRGRILTPDSEPLIHPFGQFTDQPGGFILANKEGTIPTSNPIGDIEEETNPDGTFTIKGLGRGRYKLLALGKGYGSVQEIVDVGVGEVDIGDITLVTGAKLSGAIYLADGISRPDTTLIETVLAVSESFSDIIIARLESAGGTITQYELSGFKPNKSYSILGFPKEGMKAVSLGANLIVNEDSTKDLKVGESVPLILPTVRRESNGDLTITYTLSVPLENDEADIDGDGIADNDDLDDMITIVSGGGALSGGEIATDRLSVTITYTPAASDSSFELRFMGEVNQEDSSDGTNYLIDETFTFYAGIGQEVYVNVENAFGGSGSLDTSEVGFAAGGFGDNTDAVEVAFRESDALDDVISVSGSGGANSGGAGAGSMALARAHGFKGYPAGMSAAMRKADALDIDPFSSFYDIFLPAGVSHFFPEGREASLCLTYDSSVSDPYALNIYYYNEQTNEYLLENEGKVVDTDNLRICVSISHASVFTVLASSASVITGAGYTGDLNILNFPNPFNLKSKTVTLQDPGSNSASQTIEGTMIKMSIPSTMSGTLEVEIFNVLGEKVRSLNGTAAGGAHVYMEWDGKNEKGEKVASGTYIGRFTIGGSNERFFKMAVLK